MDTTTRAVRDMYEQFPYPSGKPVNRVGTDVELLLSYGATAPGKGRRHVLDAGCGRGLGILGAATLQPEVRFLGVDVNRVALRDSSEQAAQRGLKNASFAECDLMTLEGLETPAGGFDVIVSSGVLHHLQDPGEGLARLREHLAPHGMLSLMIYGKHGRDPLMRAAAAIDRLFPADTPVAERLPLARETATVAADHVLGGTRFADTAQVDDVELVDRLLNVNETSYDAAAVRSLLAGAGLRRLRWAEPADWDPERLLPDCALRRRLLELDAHVRETFIDLIWEPAGLELVVAHAENGPRLPLDTAGVPEADLAVNPEIVITTGVRSTPAGQRTETLGFVLRKRDEVTLPAGPIAAALLVLRDKPGPWRGKDLLRAFGARGVGEGDAVAVVLELLKHEVLYRPW